MEKLKQFPALQWVLPVMGILALLLTLVFGSAGWDFILLCGAVILCFEYFFSFRESKFFNPYSWMILAPLLLLKYSSITDFRIRMLCFIFFIYIFSIAYTRSVRKINFSLVKAKPVNVWLTAFTIFLLASMIVYIQGIHLSGDEPHYILISQSLVEDGDFDLKNNIEEKTYFKYLPIEIRFHGGEYQGRYLSFHLPGVSFLLIPFYWLFKLLGGLIPPALFFRLAASVINAFFALCLFYLLKMKFPGKDITGFWLLFLSIFPLVFHSIHLYPELPAATLMMAAYLFAFSEKKNYLLAGLFLSLIPWFHVKYIPPLVVLTLAILYNLVKPVSFEKEKIKRLFLFFIFPVISLILLVIYCKTLYGTYSPTNIFPKESYWATPWLLRLKVFLAYFLDQRDGLLFYCPLFFLFFFSLKKKVVIKVSQKYLLLGIALSYVFFHAFTTVRGAYAPAGRPLIFVSWIFIIFIAHFYYNILNDHFSFKLLAGLSFFILAWLFYYPLFVYQPVFSHTIERASGINLFFGSDFIPLRHFSPSFLTSPESGHPANFLWIGFLVLLLVVHYVDWSGINKKFFGGVQMLHGAIFQKRPPGRRRHRLIVFLLFLSFVFLYCFYPHVHLINKNKHTGKTISFYNNSKNFRYVPGRKGFRIKVGNNYDIFIDRKMIQRDNVTFRFIHTDVSDVIVRNGKRLLFQSDREKESSFSMRLSSLKTLRVKNKLVSHLGIETRASRENSFLWLEID